MPNHDNKPDSLYSKTIRAGALTRFCAIITLSALSACSSFDGVTALFRGDASLVLSTNELVLTEGQRAASFAISLASRPKNDVFITLSSGDTGEARLVPEQLVFEPAAFDIPQTVSVFPLSDCSPDGDQKISLRVDSVVSKDRAFQSDQNDQLLREASALIRDSGDDRPQLLLQSANPVLETSEDGGSDRFLVSLSCPPEQPVQVALTSDRENEGRVDVSTITLNGENYNQGQLVRVTGQSDCSPEPDQTYAIRAETSSPDERFTNLSASLPALNKDVAKTPGLLVLGSHGQFNRGIGSFNNVQVSLSCEPAAPVTLSTIVNGLDNGYTLHNPAGGEHIFTSGNWNTPTDVIIEILSNWDGEYTLELSTDQPAEYPAETVYFGDFGKKFVIFQARDLLAGNHVEVADLNSGDFVTLTDSDTDFQIPFEIGSDYQLSVLAVEGTGPNQACQWSTGSDITGENITGHTTLTETVDCQITNLNVGGQVSGLEAGNTLDLEISGTDYYGTALATQTQSIIANDNYNFSIPDGSQYSVTITSVGGGGPEQECRFSSNDSLTRGETLAKTAVTNLNIECAKKRFGITITTGGLDIGDELTLRFHGQQKNLTINANGTQTTTDITIPDEDPYSVAVTSQPEGKICSFYEKQHGVTDNGLNLNLVCVEGYMESGGFRASRGNQPFFPPYATTNTRVYEDPTPGYWTGIVHHYGDLYAGLSGGNGIYRFSTTGSPSGQLALMEETVQGLTHNGLSLYASEWGGGVGRIWKIRMATGDKVLLAGDTSGYQDGALAQARFNTPYGLSLADDRYLFVSEFSPGRLRAIDLATGVVSTILTGLNSPADIVATDDYIYFVDGHSLRRLSWQSEPLSFGSPELVAGSKSQAGFRNAKGGDARFNGPHDITTDGVHFYLTEYSGGRVRKIDGFTSEVTTLAGGGATDSDGLRGPEIGLTNPLGIAFDGEALFVTQAGANSRVLRLAPEDLNGYWSLHPEGGTNNMGGASTLSASYTVTGAPTAVTGPDGQQSALRFNGTNDQLVIPKNSDLHFTGGDFTISLWARPAAVQQDPVFNDNELIHNWLYGQKYSFTLRYLDETTPAPGEVIFSRYDGSNNPTCHSVGVSILDGKYHHLAAVLRGNELRLYIDGHLTCRAQDTTTAIWQSHVGDIRIGARHSANYFTGDLAGVHLFNRSLNDGEIAALAAEAEPVLVKDGHHASLPGTGLLHSLRSEPGALTDIGALRAAVTPNGSFPDLVRSRSGGDGGAVFLDADISKTLALGAGDHLPRGADPRSLCVWFKPHRLPDSDG